MRINIEALRERSESAQDLPLLDSLVHSSDRATRLASQLLSLMRSDPVAAPKIERLRFDELVQDRLAELAAIARHRNIELECSSPPDPVWVSGEREGLQSLVVNLVENAIKYSPREGTVLVQLLNLEDGVEMSVADAGPGIPLKLRESVFEPFYRAPDQNQAGNGLGLAIVKAVCDRIGAVVSLGESADGGLQVTVRFPVDRTRSSD
jgi:two-component system sensor histidine kinase QseC